MGGLFILLLFIFIMYIFINIFIIIIILWNIILLIGGQLAITCHTNCLFLLKTKITQVYVCQQKYIIK